MGGSSEICLFGRGIENVVIFLYNGFVSLMVNSKIKNICKKLLKV